MKLKLIISIIGLSFSLSSYSSEFPGLVEGKDYLKTKIKLTVVNPNQDKPTLIEFFWYGCSHCYKMRPMSENLAKKFNNQINFVKYPVGFPNWESGAKIFFTLEEMKALNLLNDQIINDKIFYQIHEQKSNILFSQEARDNFLFANHVDLAKFINMYNSISIKKKWETSKQIVSSHDINGSPNYAVYSGGYTYQVSPSLVGSYNKTITNLDIILSTKIKN